MLASVLRLSGLDHDEKAFEAVDHVKAVVARMFVVAALAVAAAVCALLALVTGLVALYGWLEPTYGVFPALSIVGGVLAVLALVLIKAAMILSSGRPGSEKGATPNTIEVPPSPVPLSVTPAPVDSVVSPSSAASAATGGDMIEPLLSVLKCYAHIRSTGSAPVDDFIRQMRLSRHAVQLLLGHTMIEGTVRYLSIEVDHALAIAEQIDSSRRAAWRAWQGIVASSGYPLPRA
jgi:hypothetical protein